MHLFSSFRSPRAVSAFLPCLDPPPTPRQPRPWSLILPHSPRSRPYHHKTPFLPQFHAFFRQSLPQRTSNSSHPAPGKNPQISKRGPWPPSGLTTGETVLNTSSANPFPAAPPVESVKYRLSRKSKGLHPDRLSRRPGPRLDFPASAWLSGVIDGRLRRGIGFRARVFCRDGKQLKPSNTAVFLLAK